MSERWKVFVVALGARAVAAAALMTYLAVTGTEFLQRDERLYLKEGALAADGDLSRRAYSNVIGLLWRLTFESSWLPRLTNVVLGAAVAVAAYELGRRLAGRGAGWITGLVVALWPSLVLWSALVLKDVAVHLGLLVMLLGALVAYRGDRRGALVAAGGAVVVVLLRDWVYVVAVIALGIGAVAAVAARRRPVALSAAGALVLVALAGGLAGRGVAGSTVVEDKVTYAQIEARTSKERGATSHVRPPPDDIGDVAQGAPTAAVYNFLGPLPWQAEDPAARVLLVVELPLWYAALALAAAGAVRHRHNLWPDWIGPGALVGGVVAVLAIFEGNAGTAFRQRGMVIPVVVALAVVGVARSRRGPELLVEGGDVGDEAVGTEPVR